MEMYCGFFFERGRDREIERKGEKERDMQTDMTRRVDDTKVF